MSNPSPLRIVGAALAAALLAVTGCTTSATSPGSDAGPASGDGNTIKVTGFSGAFADQFESEIIKPYEEANPGVDVVYTPATNSAELLADLRTNKDRPTYDLVVIDSSVAVTANTEGLFSELDPALVPNLDQLVEKAVITEGYGPAITIDSLAYVYNPSLIDAAPTTWGGLADEKYAGQIVLQIADTRGIALIAGLSKEQGLDYQESIDAQLKTLAGIAPNVQTFQPQPNLYDAIRSGSVGIGVGWNARAQALHDQTPNEMAVAVPAGAGVAQISTLNLVKTSPNQEAAQKFLNYAIGAEAQQRLVERGYYGPVNNTVTLPDELNGRVASDDGLLKDAAPIDWEWISPHYADWVQRIQREVIGG